MSFTQNKHFTLEKVKDGIYAAIAKEGTGAVANAGFMDLGDQTLIFDTSNAPQAAKELRRMAENYCLTRLPMLLIVTGMATIFAEIKFLKIK